MVFYWLTTSVQSYSSESMHFVTTKEEFSLFGIIFNLFHTFIFSIFTFPDLFMTP